MNKAPMPHASISGNGAKVKVHLAQLQGFREGVPDHKTNMESLRHDVKNCIAQRAENGLPANPPVVWPDYRMSMRWDGYVTANRSITYIRTTSYLLAHDDCSLDEAVLYTADLRSSSGTCHIDLIKKTASGLCDATGHSTAVPPVKEDPRVSAEGASRMSPEMAAAMKSIVARTHGTSHKKTVLGVTCEVLHSPARFDPAESTCFVYGGPFSTSAVPHTGVIPALMLEQRSRHGFNLDAIEARLDTEVNAAVFTPYLAGGFTITKKPQQ